MQDREADRLCRERLNVVPDWIFETDTRGTITYSNRVVEDLLGIRAEQVVGLSVFDLLAAPDDEKCRRCFAKAKGQTTPQGNTVAYFRDSTGGTKPLALSCVPIPPGGVLPEGVRVMARDISDIEDMHKAAREVAENYASVLDNSPIGIIILQNERAVYANPGMMTMLGYTLDDAAEGDVWRFVHPDDVERVKDIYRKRIAGEHPPEQYESIDQVGRSAALRAPGYAHYLQRRSGDPGQRGGHHRPQAG
jgi:PAS domain S-box-containing protein